MLVVLSTKKDRNVGWYVKTEEEADHLDGKLFGIKGLVSTAGVWMITRLGKHRERKKGQDLTLKPIYELWDWRVVTKQ